MINFLILIKIGTFIVLLSISLKCYGQFVKFSPTADTTAKIVAEGYLDTYFNFSVAQPVDANIPYFVSHNRHNEFNINLAYLSLKYTSDKVRAVFSPGFGTYMNSNYAAERLTLRNIFEANVGVCLSKKNKIWIDIGVMNSPFTNESAISLDQLNLTRSLAPEYVPYFLTGARLSLPIHQKFTANFYCINGWQVIEDVNNSLAFASNFEYKPIENLTVTLNTYYGNENSPSFPTYGIRKFIDFYAVFKAKKIHLSTCTYFGNQQITDSLGLSTNSSWWQTNLAAKIIITSKHSISVRAEYFSDPKSVMIKPITPVVGFNCASASLGYNCAVNPNTMFRVEARQFISEDQVFTHKESITNNQLMLIGGLAVRF
jgi:hypothetical protein